ncbi:bifunctional DNA primase/polymerase [Streptomyces sp. HSW2009]|uniref:bifunctional DNA primase/polymerase n=1 Tax=Streptomyces sp. HSW2009 TaxID=3142890 RepID=UPI0032EF022C
MLSVEETLDVTASRQIPQQRGELLLDAAVRYAEERHWEVHPGTWLEVVEGGERCSCGRLDCPAPGAHPERADWVGSASGSPAAARRMWSEHPKASILLPTGHNFDVIDVSESAGCLALARMERMDLPLGPIACTPGRRMLFWVMAGGAAKFPHLVRELGWTPAAMDLIPRGEGDYVVAPPSRVGSQGAVLWARQPTAVNRWLPDAEELASALAYACGREASLARRR